MNAPRSVAHGAYLVAIGIKGLDGALETALGLLVAIAGPEWLYSFAVWTIAPDLASHLAPHLGHETTHLVRHGAGALAQSSTFAIVYLLVHGPLKLSIAVFLLLRQRWIFPVASTILLGFVIYLTYRALLHWSGWLTAFAVFDSLTLALVLNEWRNASASSS